MLLSGLNIYFRFTIVKMTIYLWDCKTRKQILDIKGKNEKWNAEDMTLRLNKHSFTFNYNSSLFFAIGSSDLINCNQEKIHFENLLHPTTATSKT